MNIEATATTLDPETEKALIKEEREIARRYIGKMPWIMVAWGLINPTVWYALWPLTLLGIIPLWAAFIIATFNMLLTYLPVHEAQHANFAAKGKPYRWLNELIGYYSSYPQQLPYVLHRIVHLQHHTYANDPEKDPDYEMHASGWLGAIKASLISRQPRNRNFLNKVGIDEEPEKIQRAMRGALITSLSYYAILTTLAWSGFALEAFFIWWLPRHIGSTYLQVFLSWAPHHPFSEIGRYRDTRAWKSPVGNIGASGMEYHIIHHLHPAIPLHKTPVAYREMRHILEARGCRLEGI